jgi:hypothetical protein
MKALVPAAVAVTMLSGCIGLLTAMPEDCSSSSLTLLQPRDRILAWYGQPQKIAREGERETWTYTKSRSQWCGIWVGVIVLLPLLLPVCHEYDQIIYKGEKPDGATETRVSESGYMFGTAIAINPTGRCH